MGVARVQGLVALVLAGLTGAAYWTADTAYGGFSQPAKEGFSLPAAELAFQALFLAFGVPFVLLATYGLWSTGLAASLGRAAGRVLRHPRLPLLVSLLVVMGSLAVRLFVLERQAITDDEEAYVFIARTLLNGRVINPVPIDAAFFDNQFIIINERGWFGMYPVGHGLVLALGLLSGTLDAVVCVLGGLTAALTFAVGRRLLGRRRAALGVILLALSPHFVWTHATLLSQTSTVFGLMGALASWLSWQRTGRARWAAASGLALAFAILARPMPGALFAVGLGAFVLLGAWRGRLTWKAVAVFMLTAAAGALAVGLVNLVQSGSMFRTGYHAAYGALGVLGGKQGALGLSVFGGLWRENVWLLGWPLSLLPLAFARPARGAGLLWMPIVAELVYRVAVPKTVVSTTGPTYLLELVPVACLLSADGLARAGLLCRRLAHRPGGVTAFALASVAAAFVLFLPVQVRGAREGAELRGRVFARLSELGADRAVVFSESITEILNGKTWAFYAPNPAPSLDADLVFLRWPRRAADPRAAAVDFARRQFPGRPVFLYRPQGAGQLTLLAAP